MQRGEEAWGEGEAAVQKLRDGVGYSHASNMSAVSK